jgi:hypothetical protein
MTHERPDQNAPSMGATNNGLTENNYYTLETYKKILHF